MGKQKLNHKSREEAEPTVNDEAIKEEIRQLAYGLFCECGCEQGHDLEHWVDAERRVLERMKEK